MKNHNDFSLARECPYCNEKSVITDVRDVEKIGATVRYRKCKSCGFRWKTIELIYDEFFDLYKRIISEKY